MQVAAGSFTGNGADNRGITGVGFQPDFVLIQSADSIEPCFRTSAMTGDQTFVHGSSSALPANFIQSFDADGFTVGSDTHVNANLVVSHWIAVKADAAADFAVGAYTGDGTDNRAITGLGFQPGVVFIAKETSFGNIGWYSAAHAADAAQVLTGNSGTAANLIQSLDADGFTVGSSLYNESAIPMWWFAFKEVSAFTKTGTYTGDGTDNRSITGLGFQPCWVIEHANSGQSAHHKLVDMTTNSWRFGTTSLADCIQALEADGFQVGTHAEANGNTTVYRYFAIKAGTTAAGISVPVIMNQYRQRWN